MQSFSNEQIKKLSYWAQASNELYRISLDVEAKIVLQPFEQ